MRVRTLERKNTTGLIAKVLNFGHAECDEARRNGYDLCMEWIIDTDLTATNCKDGYPYIIRGGRDLIAEVIVGTDLDLDTEGHPWTLTATIRATRKVGYDGIDARPVVVVVKHLWISNARRNMVSAVYKATVLAFERLLAGCADA
jgi:hypothetical protein